MIIFLALLMFMPIFTRITSTTRVTLHPSDTRQKVTASRFSSSKELAFVTLLPRVIWSKGFEPVMAAGSARILKNPRLKGSCFCLRAFGRKMCSPFLFGGPPQISKGVRAGDCRRDFLSPYKRTIRQWRRRRCFVWVKTVKTLHRRSFSLSLSLSLSLCASYYHYSASCFYYSHVKSSPYQHA